jgi:RNA polymerase sigma factor (sigma-70 family)
MQDNNDRATKGSVTTVTGSHLNPVKARTNIANVAEIFAVHGDFLLRVFQKELNEQDAHDLWQNLFLTLTTKPMPANTTNIRSFLYRAAIHDIIDFKRRARLHEKKSDEYAQLLRQKKSERSPLQQLIGIESVTEVFRKIEENLPPAVGQVVLHKFRKQLTHRQIAEKMNIKKETVDRYLSVGTKMMEQIEGDSHEQA